MLLFCVQAVYYATVLPRALRKTTANEQEEEEEEVKKEKEREQDLKHHGSQDLQEEASMEAVATSEQTKVVTGDHVRFWEVFM